MASPLQILAQRAQLAEAAYANLFDPVAKTTIVSKTQVQDALETIRFSAAQAADFVEQWRVVMTTRARPQGDRPRFCFEKQCMRSASVN